MVYAKYPWNFNSEKLNITSCTVSQVMIKIVNYFPETWCKIFITRMWANAQRDGCPAKHRWRPLFNATKFG